MGIPCRRRFYGLLGLVAGLLDSSTALIALPFLHGAGYGRGMTKSELIAALAAKQPHLPFHDVELAVKNLLEQMSQALASGDRIEIRGFGSFSLHHRPPRIGRNPKTGESVALSGKYVPHFKPGKELKERVDASRTSTEIV